MVSEYSEIPDNKSSKNPYFLEYDTVKRRTSIGNTPSVIVTFTAYQLKKVWPYIYKFINGSLFDLLRLLKTAVKYAIRQITQF